MFIKLSTTEGSVFIEKDKIVAIKKIDENLTGVFMEGNVMFEVIESIEMVQFLIHGINYIKTSIFDSFEQAINFINENSLKRKGFKLCSTCFPPSMNIVYIVEHNNL